MVLSIQEKILELRQWLKELKAINHKQEERVNSNRERAENSVRTFLVLQVLFLLLISVRSLSPRKRDEWLVYFGTEVLSSLLFFAAFFEAVHKFYRTQYELDRNYIDLENLHHQIREAKRQSKTGHNSNGHYSVHNQSEPDAVSLLERKLYIGFVSVVLILIAAAQLYACKLLLER